MDKLGRTKVAGIPEGFKELSFTTNGVTLNYVAASRHMNPYTLGGTRSIMSKPISVTIVNVGYRSTNYWVISAGTSRLLVDLGWPGTMGRMRASLKRMNVPIAEIQYGLATHYHIDHAGVAQELKLAGVPLLVLDVQVPAIPLMKTWTKPQDQYLEVTMHDNVEISCDESRSLLERIGIPGEVLHTPGHSDDSVSLLLDNGSVFTGDLTAPQYIGLEDPEVVQESWRLLRERGATRVYPGHGPVRWIDEYPIV